MGVVYRPARSGSGAVALKVIRNERLTNEEVVNRFRREAQAAARLSHPNIVSVYESDGAATRFPGDGVRSRYYLAAAGRPQRPAGGRPGV